MTVGFREIAPRRTRTSIPEYRFDKLTIIAGSDASIMGLARQQIFAPLPLIIMKKPMAARPLLQIDWRLRISPTQFR
ncbi:hypothetical protein BK671_22380 [Pseudomonas fluorescens]|uniref:Uncharacterized protein n=1 Tax=Pseudomonas fluorescens TaxID=294 RepID=A0A423L471_PSEFL|nr:hypothetical protein BK671_22380 [Pseudomonas fluorescens]